jgi:hypothetical protein
MQLGQQPMSDKSTQEKEAWALKVMELEEGCSISAGNKTISDIVEMLRLQKVTSSPESAIEPATQNIPNTSHLQTVKPAMK